MRLLITHVIGSLGHLLAIVLQDSGPVRLLKAPELLLVREKLLVLGLHQLVLLLVLLLFGLLQLYLLRRRNVGHLDRLHRVFDSLFVFRRQVFEAGQDFASGKVSQLIANLHETVQMVPQRLSTILLAHLRIEHGLLHPDLVFWDFNFASSARSSAALGILYAEILQSKVVRLGPLLALASGNDNRRPG